MNRSPKFISTRGRSPVHGFADVLLAGLAPDGGLFMPDQWPQFSPTEIAGFAAQPYADVAQSVIGRFVGNSFTPEDIAADINAAYASFDDPRIAPLVEIGPKLYLCELFHGPTLAFKDVAMQVLGRMFARALAQRGGRATVVAATSGDTGSAAIAALGGLPNIRVFVLHPKGRVSDVQRRQMTTAPYDNVHNIALEGSFDDAQSIVKGLFAQSDFSAAVNLTAVNSINFARIAAQSVYYFTAAAHLGAAPVFVVPTGNFGDIFAGEAAMRMGLAAERLIVATNANDIMARALNDGIYAAGSAKPTLSPSMDIQVASNFERALFEASDRDAEWVNSAMIAFARDAKLELPKKILESLRGRYGAYASNDDETLATIKAVHAETGRIIDPHTAVAVAAARRMKRTGVPTVVLATAHPAKFPDAVRRAIGSLPAVPERLKALESGVERVDTLPNDLPLIRRFIESKLAT